MAGNYRLGDLLREGFEDVKFWRYGTATGGSTTTIVDTSKNFSTTYAGGIAMITRDAGGANAAPEDEFSEITGYASQTFTVSPALTAAVAAGDRYAVATQTLEYEETFELLNSALQRLDIPRVDTSLTSANNQTEYDLPVGLKQRELLRVRYETNPDDSNDQQWAVLYDWGQVPSAAASVGSLELPQLTAGRTIELTYLGKHDRIFDFDDVISEYIDPVLARASFVERIRNRQTEEGLNAAPPLRRSFDKARADFERAMQDYPIWKPQKKAKVLNAWR